VGLSLSSSAQKSKKTVDCRLGLDAFRQAHLTSSSVVCRRLPSGNRAHLMILKDVKTINIE
jgi:hypothetical protein